ncbi:hypothetical protein C8R44DRAFT_711000 [Mycena epipterygia]|nr:hypothetical protein C8R44DRAFT_711000 [Mycena epipterygia]
MSTGNAPRQVDGLWFSNDTLVLRAEDSIFRVSQSILAARSSVFQSMFEFPQPTSDGDEMMDGSPVVRLHDAAAEVEPFLRAIFDSSYFMPPPAAIDFHAVLGILRLSHKYDVNYLYKRALLHLETVYPIDLANYRSISSNALNYKDGVIALDLKAIPILQEVGATWLLPFAFYSVGTYSPKELLGAGKTWDDLPVETKQTCILLHAQHVRDTYRLLQFLGPMNCTSDSCEPIRQALLTDSVIFRGAVMTDQNPLSDWPDTEWRDLKAELCDDCFLRARAEYDRVEAEIWDGLPENCGLEEGWDGLTEKRSSFVMIHYLPIFSKRPVSISTPTQRNVIWCFTFFGDTVPILLPPITPERSPRVMRVE